MSRKIYPPIWMFFPHLHRDSYAWRLGKAKRYKSFFESWHASMSASERDKYDGLFPMPIFWVNDEHFVNDFVNISFWNKDGEPKYTKEKLIESIAKDKNKKIKYIYFQNVSSHEADKNTLGPEVFGQWYKTKFDYLSFTYSSAEQYMMRRKAALFGDFETEELIRSMADPKTLKNLGQSVKGFRSSVWNKVKHSIVLDGNYLKFSHEKSLARYLVSTKDSVLVEASPFDKIWGVGLSEYDPRIENPEYWPGENMLGFALMEVRDEIYRIYKNYNLVSWDYLEKVFEESFSI